MKYADPPIAPDRLSAIRALFRSFAREFPRTAIGLVLPDGRIAVNRGAVKLYVSQRPPGPTDASGLGGFTSPRRSLFIHTYPSRHSLIVASHIGLRNSSVGDLIGRTSIVIQEVARYLVPPASPPTAAASGGHPVVSTTTNVQSRSALGHRKPA